MKRLSFLLCGMLLLGSRVRADESAPEVKVPAESRTGLCFDGDTEKVFVISEAVPRKVLEGGYLPDVVHADDEKTQGSITWEAAPGVRSEMKVIGRYKGHEIVDLVFHAAGGMQALFEARVLGFRTDAGASSPMMPFLVIGGEQIRWYEQVFTCGEAGRFLLEVSKTMDGNGVAWANITFGFSDVGAYIVETSSGGRNQSTIIRKFGRDGAVVSTEELDGN